MEFINKSLFISTLILLLPTSSLAKIKLVSPPIIIEINEGRDDCDGCLPPSGKIYCLYDIENNSKASQVICLSNPDRCTSELTDLNACLANQYKGFDKADIGGYHQPFDWTCVGYPLEKAQEYDDDSRDPWCEQKWMMPVEKVLDKRKLDSCEKSYRTKVRERICQMDELSKSGALSSIIKDHHIDLKSASAEQIISAANQTRDGFLKEFNKLRGNDKNLKSLEKHARNLRIASSFRSMITDVNVSVRRLVDSLRVQLLSNAATLDVLIEKNLYDAASGSSTASTEVLLLKRMKILCPVQAKTKQEIRTLKLHTVKRRLKSSKSTSKKDTDYEAMEFYFASIDLSLNKQKQSLSAEEQLNHAANKNETLTYAASTMCAGLLGSSNLLDKLDLEQTQFFVDIADLETEHNVKYAEIITNYNRQEQYLKSFDSIEAFAKLNSEVNALDDDSRECAATYTSCEFKIHSISGYCKDLPRPTKKEPRKPIARVCK